MRPALALPLALVLVLSAPVYTGAAACADGRAGLARAAVQAYASLVESSYDEAARGARALRRAVARLNAAPTEEALAAARRAWVTARVPYGRTEAFRFYQGPIDAAPEAGAPEGPEGRLNAWPLNEAYIDGVVGRADDGLIDDARVPITRAALLERNAVDDEANVTLGWHAIEFLLWGQDLDLEGPGARPVADFIGAEGPSARRRAYLEVCVELLVDDLEGLAVAWGPGKGRYRARFLALDSSRALGHILTGLATLSGFELASERIAVPLDSRSQEDEHSCFSDTTHQDFAANAEGVARVYFGLDPDREGPLGRLVRAADPRLADELCGVLKETVRRAQAVPSPVDRALAAADGDPERVRLEELVAALQRQAKLLKAVGVALGIDVRVRAE